MIEVGQIRNWIASILSLRRPIDESMSILIDRCEAANPHSDWAEFRVLPYGDTKHLREWLVRPFCDEPPAQSLNGLWFGLFNPVWDELPVTDIYVCGSERFDPFSEDGDWACGPEWWPESRYAHSAHLADVYRISYGLDAPRPEEKKCLGNDAEEPVAWGYGAFAVRELLEQLDPSLVLGKSDSLGIAVGFDSGDFVLLGQLTRDGLVSIAGP